MAIVSVVFSAPVWRFMDDSKLERGRAVAIDGMRGYLALVIPPLALGIEIDFSLPSARVIRALADHRLAGKADGDTLRQRPGVPE